MNTVIIRNKNIWILFLLLLTKIMYSISDAEVEEQPKKNSVTWYTICVGLIAQGNVAEIKTLISNGYIDLKKQGPSLMNLAERFKEDAVVDLFKEYNIPEPKL